MTIASIAAFAIGQYPEAVEVILFYQVGELFEKIAVGRSRQAVSDLLDLCPDEATVLRDGKPETVLVDEVEVGEHILVRPGEKIPLDASVFEGHTTIDTAALTGESMPVSAAEGDAVCSGCVNLSGAVELVVTKPASESTASKIMELVEESASSKAKTEQFITKFARYYTPCVVIAALILAVVPPLITGQPFSGWIYRALTFLIISCPCALVISVPLSFFGGIGCASKNGVLVKGSNYLEALSHAQTVVMDKTGTLTEGKFHVTKQKTVEITPEEQLELAALAESASNHPIAQSLKEAYGKAIDTERVEDVQEIAGHGVSARVDGKQVLAGNAAYLEDAGLQPETPAEIGTAVHLAVNGVYAGYILIADTIKPDAAQAVQAFRQAGVSTVAMLTGDSELAAEAVGDTLQLDEVHAKCLPADKVQFMQAYRAKLAKGRTLVFVGDGMNDAPVLAQSDVALPWVVWVLMRQLRQRIWSFWTTSLEAGAGDAHRQKDYGHRTGEYRLCTGCQGNRAGTGCCRSGTYRCGSFRRCRGVCHCDSEFHPCHADKIQVIKETLHSFLREKEKKWIWGRPLGREVCLFCKVVQKSGKKS